MAVLYPTRSAGSYTIPWDTIFDIKKLGRIEKIGHRITGDRTVRTGAGRIGWEYA